MIDFIKFKQILESIHNCSCSCFPCRKMNDCKKCNCKDCKCKYCKCKDYEKVVKNTDPKDNKVAAANKNRSEKSLEDKGPVKKKILSSLDDKISRKI